MGVSLCVLYGRDCNRAATDLTVLDVSLRGGAAGIDDDGDRLAAVGALAKGFHYSEIPPSFRTAFQSFSETGWIESRWPRRMTSMSLRAGASRMSWSER